MKTMKKLFSLLVVAAMTLTMAVVASAAGIDDVTITVNGGNATSVYSAYQLLDVAADPVDATKITYSLNSKYTAILNEVTGKSTQADIITYISGLNDNDMRDFADAVYKEILSADPAIAADATSAAGGVFSTVNSGYYLIAETTVGAQPDEASLVMVNTAGLGNVTVTTKESVPTVEKKVKEKNDTNGTTSDWQDAADYDIGDDIEYMITGTLPNDSTNSFAEYDTYKYEFQDTLSAGLDYKADTAVVKIDDKTVDAASYELTYADRKLVISFADLKDANSDGETIAVTKDSVVTVTYTATLNENAVIGSGGNPNTVKLVFSNNPYGTGEGNTPEDKATVFTYKLEANKVDGAQAPLKDAGFTLYKKTNGVTENDGYVAVGSEVKDTDLTTFTWTGLDAGEYKLVETTVPTGYNKAADVIFAVTATYDTTSVDPQLTALNTNNNAVTLKDNSLDTATLTTIVVNQFGAQLPTTGGIGTTIFYIVGSMLFVGAGILLVTKKRMSSEA